MSICQQYACAAAKSINSCERNVSCRSCRVPYPGACPIWQQMFNFFLWYHHSNYCKIVVCLINRWMAKKMINRYKHRLQRPRDDSFLKWSSFKMVWDLTTVSSCPLFLSEYAWLNAGLWGQGEKVRPINKDLVTVYFSDISGFTLLSSSMSAAKVMFTKNLQDNFHSSCTPLQLIK